MMTDTDIHEVKLLTAGPYDFKFDANNPHWVSNADYNATFLLSTQRYFNDLLRARGYVFLSDVLSSLDFPETQASRVVGWVNSDESEGIDFGANLTEAHEGVISLNFNVDGVIIDVLPLT